MIKAEATRRWKEFLAGNKSALPDNVRVPVFQILLSTGVVGVYEEIRQIYSRAEANIEKVQVLSSIGHVADLDKKKQVLEWALSGDIKTQDCMYAIGSVCASTKAAIPLCWQFFKDNFTKIQNLLTSSNASLMSALIDIVTRGFSTAEAAAEVKTFFEKHPLPSNARKIQQTVESITATSVFWSRVRETRLVEESFWMEMMN